MTMDINHTAVNKTVPLSQISQELREPWSRWKELSIFNCCNFPLNSGSLSDTILWKNNLSCTETKTNSPSNLKLWNNMEKSDPSWSSQVIFHSCITKRWSRLTLHRHQTTKSFPHCTEREREKNDNNRFVFQWRENGALQHAGNDKYLHAGPREGQTTAALLSQMEKHHSAADAGGFKPSIERKMFVCHI